MNYRESLDYKKINKTLARKYYDKGYEVLLMPNKFRLNNCWINPYPLKKIDNYDFNEAIIDYEYYNCSYETGYYASYYVRRDLVI